MYYYSLITASILMFSLQFFFNQKFLKRCGDSLQATLVFSGGSAMAGLIILLFINNFQLDCSWFALFMAVLTALDNVAYTFCSLKSLGKINLSLYSMFAMLGGMTLPVLAGVLFFDEQLTIGMSMCVVLIGISLLLTIEKKSDSVKKRADLLWYMGVFVLNGMSGVLAKIYQAAAVMNKPNEAAYSILCAVTTAIMSFLPLLFLKKDKFSLPFLAFFDMLCHGTLCRFANYLLLLTLVAIPVSVQYPLVTGGVIIASTAIGLFSGQKPSVKEGLAVAIAIAGIVILIF